jgi:hypothetical protein
VRLGNVSERSILTIAVVNILGMTIGTEVMNVLGAHSQIEYSCLDLLQGAYMLEVREANGSVLSRGSFINSLDIF